MTTELALNLTYENAPIRMAGTQDRPEWVAADVCKVLGLNGNASQHLQKCRPSEKGISQIDTLRGKQELLTVTEAGLYRLIFRSDKPEAERFQTWVFNSVLPTIRQYGTYPAPAIPKSRGGRPKGSLGKNPPAYSKHVSGLARVRVGGKDIYLGKHGSPESYRLYGELLAGFHEGQANAGVRPPAGTAYAFGLADASENPPSPSIEAAIEPQRPLKSLVNAIDPSTDLIELSEVHKLPWMPQKITRGRVYGWHCRGCYGVHLETLSVGGTLYTSESAVLIFFSNCARVQSGQAQAAQPGSVAQAVQRRNQIDRANQYLDRVLAPKRKPLPTPVVLSDPKEEQ